MVWKLDKKVIATKENTPISDVPSFEKKKLVFGKLKDTVHFLQTIIEPIDEIWDAGS